jgi:hypothetical protein
MFMPSKVRIVIGQPIDLSDHYEQQRDSDSLQQLTLRVLKEIASLADQPDFEPKLAGRRWNPSS